MKFGDMFILNGTECVVVAYFSDRDWWYVEKNTSRVVRAKFPPEECKWIRN